MNKKGFVWTLPAVLFLIVIAVVSVGGIGAGIGIYRVIKSLEEIPIWFWILMSLFLIWWMSGNRGQARNNK